MAKRIESSEIVQDDLLKNLRESVSSTEAKTKALSLQLSEVNDALREIKKTASTIKGGILDLGKTNTKDLDARAKAQKVSNQLAKDAIEANKIQERLSKEILKSEQQNQKLYEKFEAERLKQIQKLSDAEAKAHAKKEKQYNKEIEEYSKVGAIYSRQSKALTEMRNRYKDLAVMKMNGIKLTKEEEKEYRRLIPQIRQTDNALKKIDASVGQHQRNVGNYSKAVGGLRNALGQLGLAFGVSQTVRFAKDALVDFEEGAADIAKTTGLTTENAKKLSRELLNFDTKTSVSELQGLTAAAGSLNVEGKSNILDFVENADKAFVALGDDLGGTSQEIATNVGKIAGVFGDEAEFGIGQAINKVGSSINDLAGKSKAAAAPILDFTQRMAGLGNLIKSYDATALGAFFDEGGQSVEVAASTLNTLLPKLATDYKKFAKVAGLSAKEFKKLAEDSPVEALKAVANGAKNSEKGLFNLSKTVQSFGVDSARATSIVGYLANNTDRLTELQKISNDAYKNGTSLTEEFNKKNETLGANIEKVKKEFLKYAIGLDESENISGKFADTLKFLAANMQTILNTAKNAIKVFVIYKATMMAMSAAQTLFGDGSGKLNVNMKQLTSNFKDSASAGKGLANSLKGGIWAAAIAGVIELSLEVYKAAKGFYLMRQHAQEFKDIWENPSNKELDRFLKSIDDKVKSIKELRKDNKITAEEEKKQIEAAISLHQKETKERLKSLRENKNIALIALKAEEEAYKKSPNVKTKQTIIDLNGAIRLYGEQIEKLKFKVGETDGVQESFNDTIEDGEGNTKKLNTQLKEQNRYLSEQLELVEQLNSLYRDNLVSEVQTEVDAELQRQVDSALKTGEFDNLLTNYKDLVKQRTDISIDGLKKEAELRKSELDRISKKERRKELEDIIEERDQKLSQEGLTNEQRLIIEKQFQDQLAILKKDNEERDKDINTKKLLIDGKLKKDTLEIVKQGEQDIIDAKEKTKNAQQEFLDELGTATKDTLEKNYEDERKFIELTTKFLEDQIDRRIAKLDEFAEASKKKQADLEELAKNGEIKAQQSIAEEERLQREAELAKQKLERRKAFVKILGAFLTSYTNKLEEKNTDGTPKYTGVQALGQALAEKAVLEQVISTIPAFKDGGTHEKGGLMLVNDAPGSSFREIIQTPDGKTFSPEGRNVLMNAPKGTEIHTQDQWAEMQRKDAFRKSNSLGGNNAGNSFDLMPLLKEVKGLKKAIENQPDRYAEFTEVVKGVFNLQFRETKGNSTETITNQYRKRG